MLYEYVQFTTTHHGSHQHYELQPDSEFTFVHVIMWMAAHLLADVNLDFSYFNSMQLALT